MPVKELKSMRDVENLTISPTRRLFSATHEEIISGATTDIYFVKTYETLNHLGLANVPVVAEVFTSRPGVMAGITEAINLLKDKPVKVWALNEGEEFSTKEVIMRIEGPYGEFGIYETALLGILASSSAWATAARECKQAAGGKPVLVFGSRHVHPAVAPVMERAALIGGVTGASCILGAKLGGLEPSGTIPHAAVLIAGDTLRVARAYHEVMPPNSLRIVLVDTFKDEAEEALRIAAALGPDLYGIRLDTPSERGGVTPGLVKEVRARLDQAGFGHVKIVASGGITPQRIPALLEAGVDIFGIGSYISGASPIDMTMDLKVVGGKPIAKRGRIPGLTDNPRLELKLAKE